MYDIETHMDNIRDFLQEKLNPAIQALNTEKNDSIQLKEVDSNGYIYQSLDNNPINFDPTIFYWVRGADVDNNLAAISENWEIEIVVIIGNSYESADVMTRRLFRYQRILKQLFLEDFDQIGQGFTKTEVELLNTVAFTDQNTSREYRAIGITIRNSFS